MKKLILPVLVLLFLNYAAAQKNSMEFEKNGSVEKEKAMAVTVDNNSRYRSLTSPAVEACLKKAGYNFNLASAENTVNMTVAQMQALDTKPFYIAEYFIGNVPKTGKNPYGFRIKIFERASGKVIATGSYVGKESFVTANVEMLMEEFISRLSAW